MKKKKTRPNLHYFRRILPDAEPGDPPWQVAAQVKMATSSVAIKLTEGHIIEAMKRNGQADAQNCAGTMCINKQRHLFPHPTMPLVDWFYNRVFICEGIHRKTAKATCVVYAHYDKIAELFDTDEGLAKLLARIHKEGPIEIMLHPVPPSSENRERNRPPRQPSDKPRKPRAVGSNLRMLTHMRAFSSVIAASE